MTKIKGRNRLAAWRIFFTLALLVTVLFIFSNSAEMGEVSGGKSAAVTQCLNNWFERMDMSLRLTEHYVRKAAHFCEYALLGLLLLLNLRVYTKPMMTYLAWSLFAGLLIPVLDESFQLLIPGRSGQVIDVLIDFSGVLAGMSCAGVALLAAYAVVDGCATGVGRAGEPNNL